jgi:hypothetical protein
VEIIAKASHPICNRATLSGLGEDSAQRRPQSRTRAEGAP